MVFACRHNSARSQLAAALWRRASKVPTECAGTHPAEQVHPGAVAVARRHRLAMRRARTRRLDDVLRESDLLVAVCDQAHEELAGATSHQVLHWSVPDPVRVGTDEAFEAAYDQIASRVARITGWATTGGNSR